MCVCVRGCGCGCWCKVVEYCAGRPQLGAIVPGRRSGGCERSVVSQSSMRFVLPAIHSPMQHHIERVTRGLCVQRVNSAAELLQMESVAQRPQPQACMQMVVRQRKQWTVTVMPLAWGRLRSGSCRRRGSITLSQLKLAVLSCHC